NAFRESAVTGPGLRRAAITNKSISFTNETILVSYSRTMVKSRIADQPVRNARWEAATMLANDLLVSVMGHLVSRASCCRACLGCCFHRLRRGESARSFLPWLPDLVDESQGGLS